MLRFSMVAMPISDNVTCYVAQPIFVLVFPTLRGEISPTEIRPEERRSEMVCHRRAVWRPQVRAIVLLVFAMGE